MCTYPTRPPLGRPRAHVQDRIDHLESLVFGLMQRQQQPAATPNRSAQQSDTALGAPSDRRDRVGVGGGVDVDVDVDIDVQVEVEPETRINYAERQVSPSPSDYGTIHMRESGLTYASNTHWLAILDSITQLREHVVLDDPARILCRSKMLLCLRLMLMPDPCLGHGCYTNPEVNQASHPSCKLCRPAQLSTGSCLAALTTWTWPQVSLNSKPCPTFD